jgi:predicted Rossmann fold nucleotide-binding protein DprA/Smf involved in DNA uptake
VIRRILSGGQTGVDRAALDAALARGIFCGGWCPRGRRAEDGIIPVSYPLRETPSEEYGERTRWNVRDSDATLVLHLGTLEGGTALTVAAAAELGKPLLQVDLRQDPSEVPVRSWLAEHGVECLNVAGPRESEAPGIYALARAFMENLL